MKNSSSLSERTDEVGQTGDYQPHFGHYRGAGRLWRPPTHPRWVRKRYFNHLSDKLLVAHPRPFRLKRLNYCWLLIWER